MVRRAVRVLLFAALCLVPVAMYAQGDYLDIFIVRVKPEKIADFDALAKKIVDANRHNNGDRWVAQYVMYGENNTYVFVSMRQDYADIDKGSDAFMNALSKAYGKDAAEKMTRDWNSCLISARSELRKRRKDLSRKFPADMAAYAKLIGTSRVLRTSAVHIRPGRGPEFEALLKETQAVAAKAENTQPLLVSQSMEGTSGTTYYITALRSGLEGFDKNPTTHEILGDEGYKKFLQGVSDTVESSQSMILHFAPELSNPPEEILAAAPDFWQPKPVVAAKAKPKSSGEKAASEKPKQ
ncbi:MAG TPA: hypothetical protein VE866_16170 [Candidatus Binatia bacterium]|jgi:quinol monooxygenase YgiN|nr:hypothetical protein [Candidatus Binatia bacterium]